MNFLDLKAGFQQFQWKEQFLSFSLPFFSKKRDVTRVLICKIVLIKDSFANQSQLLITSFHRI